MHRSSLTVILFFFLLLNAIGQSDSSTTSTSSIDCGQEQEHPKGDLYKVVELMPSFNGCEDVEDRLDRNNCTAEKLNTMIVGHEMYQKLIDEKEAKGSMYLSFVVEADGCLTNFNIRRDVCDGCGEIVTEIMRSLPRWNAGMSKDKPVRVLQSQQITIPYNPNN